jgi:NADPH:quinone reductase-like Zn-dependent oxidoreductase
MPIHPPNHPPCIPVQVAKALGLFVVGIAGPKNLDFVKSLGADEVRFLP